MASLAGEADPGQTVLLVPLLVLGLGGGIVLLALLLMVRLAALTFLSVLAPICLLCFGLPGFDKVGRIWVSLFVPTVFVQCVMVLLLAQSRQWMQVGAEHGSLLLSLSSLAAIYLVLKAPGLVGAAVLGQQSWSGAGRSALAAVSAARALSVADTPAGDEPATACPAAARVGRAEGGGSCRVSRSWRPAGC